MSYFVWCKNEQCRIPAFRCLLCRERCYSDRHGFGEANGALEILIRSGKYKERYVMKRRESVIAKEEASLEQKVNLKDDFIPEEDEDRTVQRILLMDEGKLIPFSTEEYTRSALYQVVESFSVECRLVRPEDPSNIIFEGKKPSRKTVPVIINKGGESVLLDSWENLESSPEQLAEATEVIGVTTVRQVFVLKRK